MFEIYSTETEPFYSHPLFWISSVIALLGMILFIVSCVLLDENGRNNRSANRGALLLALSIVLIIGSMFFIMATKPDRDSYENYFFGNPTGKAYNNPFDIDDNTLNDKYETVILDQERMEQSLAEHTGMNKVQQETTYEWLKEGNFSEFTGIDLGDESDPSDDTTISGVFYYTETDLVIITNYDTENQETVLVPTD